MSSLELSTAESSPQQHAVIHKNRWEPWGGAEVTRAEMMRSDSYGFAGVTVLSIAPPSEKRVSKDSYSWLPMNMSNLLGREFLSPKEIARINKELLSEKYSVVIFDQPTSIADLLLLAGLSKKVKEKTVIFWGNDVLTLGRNRPELFRAAKNRLLARVANTVALNTGETDQVLKSLEAIGVRTESLRKILVPIITSSEENQPVPGERSEYLDDDQIGVLFASRLAREKNLMILPSFLAELETQLRSASQDTGAYKRIGVTLVGPEQDPEILKIVKECQEKYNRDKHGLVTFTYHGVKTPHAMHTVYPHHSFVVMPADTEGFGRVTVEAMWHKVVPIVNAQSGASVEVSGEVGLLAEDAHFSQEAARHVVAGMQNNEELQQRGELARQRSSSYTIEAAGSRFAQVLRDAGLQPQN